ncbi:zinc finger protein 16-like [Portunus trituberculatus]|uniref:zinc finger protein 16-like n=1 Tax=Portunus trituberculatus TaxID=210409 RepID=UPI001E1CD7F8|nr:zinc finger protein 16-like [Portunus trituberculatus]XP_045134340.1 zinc finger protein 16-like [Portunus trituberculatus]
MPSDFSRCVSQESGVLVQQQQQQQKAYSNTSTTISLECDVKAFCSTPPATSPEKKTCVTELPSSPGHASPAASDDLNAHQEPECCRSDSVLGHSQELTAEKGSGLDSARAATPFVNTVPLIPHSKRVLIISAPASNTAGNANGEILLIGRDLVISKSGGSHVVSKYSGQNTENNTSALPFLFSSNSLTIQKIEYKCKVLQEHCKECECDTPRLHVYLIRGHKCSGACNLSEPFQCSFSEHLRPSTKSSDLSLLTPKVTEMTGKMKAKCRTKKTNSFKFSNNMIKVEPSSDDALMSDSLPQAKKKLSMADREKQEPESELLGEAECVWLPTIMSTLSGDVEYVVLDDDALNLGTAERPASPQSLKSKINNIFEDIDEKPVIQNINVTPPTTKPTRTRLPLLRRLSEINLKAASTHAATRDTVPPTGEATPTQKASEESSVDDPASSSLAEVCTNHCPSIKDIFGDISVKEEPLDDVKQDMSVDDFSKEIMKGSSKESNVATVNFVQKKEAGDDEAAEEEKGSGKGLFAKLIKEESNTNGEEGNTDGHNSDDSLGPLQIDEKYSPSSEDAGLALAKEVVELNMPSVNIISPFKIKILLGSPNRETQQVQVDPTPQAGTALVGKVVEVNNVMLTPKNLQPSSDHTAGGDEAESTGKTLDGIKSLTCIYCHTSCPNAQALARHFENHQKDGLIICYFCQKSFGDKTGMKRHMRTHTGEKPYQCKICGKRFSLPGNFKKHRDIHEDKRTEPCGVCGKTFRRKEHLKYHMRTHTGEKPFSCSECGTCFTARYSLQIHMNIHLGKKPYKCTYCNKAFSDKSTMRKHVRVHTGERPFRCQECWRCFGESGTLAAHMATHRNERPYACDKCDLRFKTTGGLRQHEKVHTGEKQYACKFCGMKFLQKYNMAMHERIHTGEKPYTCSHCQRSFRSRSCLSKHVVLHGGEDERRFGCDHCNSRFYRKAHLRRHIDMHLGIKNYECEHCKKKFCTRGTLRSHCKTFHSNGARRFPCSNCGRVFKRKVYVNTHLCANTAYKAVNRDGEKISETSSQGMFHESTDSEDLAFEVKSEPEDDGGNEEVESSEVIDIAAALSQDVKMEWDTEVNI